MRISGYGEFESVRKSIQKDERSQERRTKPADVPSGSTGEDAVQISPLGKFMSKLRTIPEVRTEKVEAARAKLEAGTLVNDESLSDGIRKMLNSIS